MANGTVTLGTTKAGKCRVGSNVAQAETGKYRCSPTTVQTETGRALTALMVAQVTAAAEEGVGSTAAEAAGAQGFAGGECEVAWQAHPSQV